MDRYQKLISDKAKKKRELLGRMFFPRTPVLFVDLEKTSNKEEFIDLVRGFADIGLNIIAMGVNEDNEFPIAKNILYIRADDKREAIEAADIAISLDQDISKVWKKGCVPISQLDGEKTVNYNPLREKGNGFYFKNATKWEIFAAVVRALETYQFPYDWENLIREILNVK